MRKEKIWRTSCIIVLLVGLFGCGILTFGWFSFPSTNRIAHDYLTAIIAGDLNQALKYTTNNHNRPLCVDAARQSALQDISAFQGAKVRNIRIEVRQGSGSDNTIQIGRIQFEYKLPGNVDWQQGYTQILTTFDNFGFRYFCGKVP